SAGTIHGGKGSFIVSGSHTYAKAGSFAVSVTLAEHAPGTATKTVSGTAKVVLSSDTLKVTADNLSVTEGQAFSGAVATLSSSNTSSASSAFTATIDWGDGATSAGTISGAKGAFSVA